MFDRVCRNKADEAIKNASNLPRPTSKTAGGGFFKNLLNRKLENAQKYHFGPTAHRRLLNNYRQMKTPDASSTLSPEPTVFSSRMQSGHSLSVYNNAATIKYSSAQLRQHALNSQSQAVKCIQARPAPPVVGREQQASAEGHVLAVAVFDDSITRQDPGLEKDSSFNTLAARSQKNIGMNYPSREAIHNLQKKSTKLATLTEVEKPGQVASPGSQSKTENRGRPLNMQGGHENEPEQEIICSGPGGPGTKKRARTNQGTRSRHHLKSVN